MFKVEFLFSVQNDTFFLSMWLEKHTATFFGKCLFISNSADQMKEINEAEKVREKISLI